jgi:protein-tyrosine phosphatase
VRILFVCTGNVCRSPVAERLATAWAREKLAHSPEADMAQIRSAGLSAVANRPIDPHSAAALVELGGDPAGFRSHEFTPELAADADLVLTMTRDQRRTVLEASPRGLRRTFTLTEAADLLQRADLTGLSLLPLTARARELGRRLDAARAGRPTADSDDIADPIGQTAVVHQEVAGLVAAALRPLADVLFTSVRIKLPAPVAV